VVTGIRNPQSYTSNKERTSYYGSFLQKGKGFTQIRHFDNQASLIAGFENMNGQRLPFLIIYDIKTDAYYDLDCYEDVADETGDFNNNKFAQNTEASEERVNLFFRYKEKTVPDSSMTPIYKPVAAARFEVYYIGGIYGEQVKETGCVYL
jgi:hypothetical protein